jgi:chorismate synthase
MNSVGKNIKITFFGESHSPTMGVTIDGLQPGLSLDLSLIKKNLNKRKPNKSSNTERIEKDDFKIISGLFNEKTDGTPLTFLVKNKSFLNKDYSNLNIEPRPSHADYPASIKYKGMNNYYGGGMFSGRLTVLWVIVGSIAQQILEEKDIYLGSHIYSLYKIKDQRFDLNNISKDQLVLLNNSDFPLIDQNKEKTMIEEINETKNSLDSLGGVIESAIINLPVGIGQPFFHSVEGYISYLLFSIPSVKGVDFGLGFEISQYKGSEVNDEYIYENGQLKTITNNNGGVLGGLTTGRPLVVKTAFKPIASIKKEQNTVNLENKENTKITIKGRHDSQILTRVYPVVNAVLNFAILDLLYKEIDS